MSTIETNDTAQESSISEQDAYILLKQMFKVNISKSNPREIKLMRRDADANTYSPADTVSEDFILAKHRTRMSDIVRMTGEISAKVAYLDDQMRTDQSTYFENGLNIKNTMENLDKDIADLSTRIDVITNEYNPGPVKESVEEIRQSLETLASEVQSRMENISTLLCQKPSLQADVEELKDNFEKLGSQMFDNQLIKVREDASTSNELTALHTVILKKTDEIAELRDTINLFTSKFVQYRQEMDEKVKVDRESLWNEMKLATQGIVAEMLAEHRKKINENIVNVVNFQLDRKTTDHQEKMEGMERKLAGLSAELTTRDFNEASNRQDIEKRLENLAEHVKEKVHELKDDIKDRVHQLQKELNESIFETDNNVEHLKEEIKEVRDRVEEIGRNVSNDIREEVLLQTNDVHDTVENMYNHVRDEIEKNTGFDEKIKTVLDQNVFPAVMSLAVDIKDLKEVYQHDLLRVERDCTNRVDTVAADILHRVSEVTSESTGNANDIRDLKMTLNAFGEDVSEIKNLFDKDAVILSYDV